MLPKLLAILPGLLFEHLCLPLAYLFCAQLLETWYLRSHGAPGLFSLIHSFELSQMSLLQCSHVGQSNRTRVDAQTRITLIQMDWCGW